MKTLYVFCVVLGIYAAAAADIDHDLFNNPEFSKNSKELTKNYVEGKMSGKHDLTKDVEKIAQSLQGRGLYGSGVGTDPKHIATGENAMKELFGYIAFNALTEEQKKKLKPKTQEFFKLLESNLGAVLKSFLKNLRAEIQACGEGRNPRISLEIKIMMDSLMILQKADPPLKHPEWYHYLSISLEIYEQAIPVKNLVQIESKPTPGGNEICIEDSEVDNFREQFKFNDSLSEIFKRLYVDKSESLTPTQKTKFIDYIENLESTLLTAKSQQPDRALADENRHQWTFRLKFTLQVLCRFKGFDFNGSPRKGNVFKIIKVIPGAIGLGLIEFTCIKREIKDFNQEFNVLSMLKGRLGARKSELDRKDNETFLYNTFSLIYFMNDESDKSVLKSAESIPELFMQAVKYEINGHSTIESRDSFTTFYTLCSKDESFTARHFDVLTFARAIKSANRKSGSKKFYYPPTVLLTIDEEVSNAQYHNALGPALVKAISNMHLENLDGEETLGFKFSQPLLRAFTHLRENIDKYNSEREDLDEFIRKYRKVKKGSLKIPLSFKDQLEIVKSLDECIKLYNALNSNQPAKRITVPDHGDEPLSRRLLKIKLDKDINTEILNKILNFPKTDNIGNCLEKLLENKPYVPFMAFHSEGTIQRIFRNTIYEVCEDFVTINNDIRNVSEELIGEFIKRFQTVVVIAIMFGKFKGITDPEFGERKIYTMQSKNILLFFINHKIYVDWKNSDEVRDDVPSILNALLRLWSHDCFDWEDESVNPLLFSFDQRYDYILREFSSRVDETSLKFLTKTIKQENNGSKTLKIYIFLLIFLKHSPKNSDLVKQALEIREMIHDSGNKVLPFYILTLENSFFLSCFEEIAELESAKRPIFEPFLTKRTDDLMRLITDVWSTFKQEKQFAKDLLAIYSKFEASGKSASASASDQTAAKKFRGEFIKSAGEFYSSKDYNEKLEWCA